MTEPKQTLLIVMETRYVSGSIHREPMMLYSKEDELTARSKAQEIGDTLKRMNLREAMVAMGITQVGVTIQVMPFMDGSRIQMATEMPKVVMP